MGYQKYTQNLNRKFQNKRLGWSRLEENSVIDLLEMGCEVSVWSSLLRDQFLCVFLVNTAMQSTVV
jgi:hypothetical protein